ncbi:hypothetical protein ACQW02_05560 [Humitalea sp. 24SJ18S-53]|uniref:hypothetical protein n=1 Tax=Humitalea sp. 24SJ18S-53 TaxID=3422307 RepID=UPI003D66E1A5
MMTDGGGWRTAVARVGVGLAQGIALFMLSRLLGADEHPASPVVMAVFGMLVAMLPPCVLVALGHMRGRSLAVWVLVIAVVLTGIAVHGALNAVGGNPVPFFAGTAALLFIAQALVTAADRQGGPIAAYGLYFEIAWRNGLLLALALAFLGAFWLLLWLGATLFAAIGIGLPWRILAEPEFFVPATPTVFAAGVHLADARAGLARGIRVILLTLLAWLSPLLALIVLGFLAALPFTGLAPLWQTGHGAGALLCVVPVLVLLVNATYQDGAPDAATPAMRLPPCGRGVGWRRWRRPTLQPPAWSSRCCWRC